MKVLLVNSLYPPIIIGGAEVSVSLLAKALAEQSIDVTVASLHEEKTVSVETIDGVKIYRLPLDNIYWPFGISEKPSAAKRLLWHVKDTANSEAARRFGTILDEIRPDVVNFHNITGFSASVWNEAKSRNIPIVHTLRDYSLICKRSTTFRNKNECINRCFDCKSLTFYHRSQSSKIDYITSISEYLIESHKRSGFFSETRSSVIRNIADLSGAHRRQPEPTVVFGYIGRIEDEKGIEVVLRATSRLTHPDWRLRIAGRGIESYVADIKKRYDDPRIEWLGFTKPADFYASIDVCIISSVWPEPLSRVMIDAIASGRPTIASTAGGIPEIAGHSALIGSYAPRDDESLANLMTRALTERDRWLVASPPSESVIRLFSPEAIAREYIDVYRKLCRDRD